MPGPHRNASSDGASPASDLDPVAITTNVRRLNILRAVTLRDLAELLEQLHEEVHALSEVSDHFRMPTAYDVRSHAAWVVESIGVLDDLGWSSDTGWDGYRA